MKIAITSDWHGHKPDERTRTDIDSCDVLILCGDVFEPSINNDKLEKYLKKLTSSGKKVVMTPGNHDFGIYLGENPQLNHYNSWVSRCKRYTAEYLKSELGIDCLIDSEIVLDGIRIYGTPWTPIFCDWAYMLKDNEELAEKYGKIPDAVDILICHGPPFDPNSKIDSCSVSLYDGQPEHLGSEMLYNAILEKKPKWFFCGHIHSGQHEETMIGKTRCANVSLLGEDYKIHYPVKILEV